MNLIDSALWLEYFAGTDQGELIAPLLEKPDGLIVPSITIYEVFKKIWLEKDEDKALFAAAHMKQGRVVDLDSDLAVLAAKTGRDRRLAMADSVIYATALKFGAILHSQDRPFDGLEGVVWYARSR
jgi:predicted nucleic acid-binding protein